MLPVPGITRAPRPPRYPAVMRHRLLTSTLALLVLASCGDARTEVTPEARDAAAQKAAAAARQLGSALLTELATSLASGPPQNSVHLCADIAQRVSAGVAADQGFRIARTALRVRNPANAPDEWERSVLERWSGQEGDLAPHTDVVDTPDGPVLRWMSPIRLVGLCTQCHGDDTQITAAVRAAIDDRYPDDQATGFAVGELRGAFTATVPLR